MILTLLLITLGFTILLTQYLISRKTQIYEKVNDISSIQLPKISIIIPIYRESLSSITNTLESISKQNYPKHLMNVFLIVEADDYSEDVVNELLSRYSSLNIKIIKHSIPRGCRRLKAKAINYAFNYTDTEIVGIYDADNIFPSDQVLNAVLLLMSKNYVAIGTRVYRFRNGLLGTLTLIESYIWHNITIPFMKYILGLIPLSGEGLFIRRDIVKEIPETLAEDSILAFNLQLNGYKVGLLDSYVFEKAPIDLINFIKQRIRWYRGYLENLMHILKCRVKSSSRFKIVMLYLLITLPLASIFVSLILILVDIYIYFNHINAIVIFTLLSLTYIVATLIIKYLVYLSDNKSLMMLSLYWFFIAVVALISVIIPIKSWLKTQR